ncbi:MAG: FHA domain-containing protein [Myxococcota bacterium]|jgi:hypothetical protein|nr:FHA domain-containing protein [Myxococcota bacterium]
MFKLVRVKACTAYHVSNKIFDSLCIGRGKQNDLSTTDRLISSSHARLFVRDGVLLVVDLDSRNGTEVSGQRLTPFEPQSLMHGQVVEFGGRLSFRLEVSPDAEYPLISIDEPTEQGSGSVLRILALPDGVTPVLDAGRLLALHQLLLRLMEPSLMRHGGRWLEALVSGASRLFKRPELQLIRRENEQNVVLFPLGGESNLRAETLEECLKRGKAVAVELLNVSEFQSVDVHQTFDASMHGSPFVGTLCAPIRMGQQLWGYLSAVSENGVRYSFDELDVWLLDQLAQALGTLLPLVSMTQLLGSHRDLYRRTAREARALTLSGSSTALGFCIEQLALLAPQQEPVYLLAPAGSEVRTCATLLHALSHRAGNLFELLGAAQVEAELEQSLQYAIGGTLCIESLEALGEQGQARLMQALDDGWERQLRFVFCTPYPPDQLAEIFSFPVPLLRRLAKHVIRLPDLLERTADLATIAVSLALELEPRCKQPFAEDALALFNEFETPSSFVALRELVGDALAADEARPVSSKSLLTVLSARLPRSSFQREQTVLPATPGVHPCETQGQQCPLSPIAQALLRAGLFEC